jgi:hypothetical protein
MNNIGHSSRLPYDRKFYPDHLDESVGPGDYRLQTYSIYSNNSCVPPVGVNYGFNGAGVSTTCPYSYAMSQRLVDVDSDLSNRNLKQARTRDARVNIKNLSQQKLFNLKNCPEGVTCQNDSLSPEYTHISASPKNCRGVGINRFFNLKTNPQANIFYPWAINTTLEAKDNHNPEVPHVVDVHCSLPHEDGNKPKTPCINIPYRYL